MDSTDGVCGMEDASMGVVVSSKVGIEEGDEAGEGGREDSGEVSGGRENKAE